MKTLSKDQGPGTKDQRLVGKIVAPRLPLSLSLLLPLFLFLAPLAHAQWQTVNYTLHGGWNSIYLHGDASYSTIDALVATRPEVLSIWRWNPNPSQIQFSTSTLVPTGGKPEWSTWTRNGPANTLLGLTGQAAYIVECSGTAANTYQLSIVQRALPPRSTWVRNGANFLGFPSRLVTGYPTFANYFATFPVAIATNSKIYKYAGGPLGPANPIQVFSTTAESLDRDQAYWFEAAVVGDFYAPLEVSPSNLDGLIYGRNGSLISVRVRNRTAAAVNLTAAPVDSAAAPTGQDQVTGPVPLTYRSFNATTAAYEFRAVTAGNPVGIVVGPQSTMELFFGVDRAQITGATNALYASLLRFTDGGNLMDVSLPVSARVTSLTGLWIGDVTVTNVSGRTAALRHTCNITRTPAVGQATTVTNAGIPSSSTTTNTLAPLALPYGTGGTLTYQWKKDNVAIPGATSATLTLAADEALASGAFGTATPRPVTLRVLLHVDDSGTARLLSQVFIGKLAAAPNNVGLCTFESALKTGELATARRFSATHLPPNTVVATGTGAVALGQTLVRTVPLAYDATTNPFVHTYHPDHDNRNARFDAKLLAGVESPDISRALSFAFTTTPPAGGSAQGWGSTVIGGTYAETITGIHTAPLTVTGIFQLRRVSELGSITTN